MHGSTSFEVFTTMLYEARKRKYPNRDEAERYLPVCSRILHDYETGKKVPPPDTIAAISEALGEPFLRRVYCANICPIGQKKGSAMDKPEDLARVALRLVKELQDVVARKQEFINMVHDGQIEEHERGEYFEFLQELRELKHAVEVLELWTEAELETKKEAACAAI